MNPKFLQLSSIVLIVIILLSSCSSGKITQRGLVSYYPFDGNAQDSKGNHHGKDVDVQYQIKGDSSADKVLVLNGVDSYVDLTTPFDYEEVTISLWFKVNSAGADFDLIFTADYAKQKYGLMNLATKIEKGVHRVFFNLSGEIISREIKTDVWYHAVLVKKKDQRYEYYFNGNLVVSGSIERYLSSVRGYPVAQVGTIRTRETGFFDGAVNNLRIYKRALLPKEVAALAKEQ